MLLLSGVVIDALLVERLPWVRLLWSELWVSADHQHLSFTHLRARLIRIGCCSRYESIAFDALIDDLLCLMVAEGIRIFLLLWLVSTGFVVGRFDHLSRLAIGHDCLPSLRLQLL